MEDLCGYGTTGVCELAPSPSSPGFGSGNVLRDPTPSVSLAILLYNLHTSVFLAGCRGNRGREERRQ